MHTSLFKSMFDNLSVPVIVSRKDKNYSVIYMNAGADQLLGRAICRDAAAGNMSGSLSDVLRLEPRPAFDEAIRSLEELGPLTNYGACVIDRENNKIPVLITVNLVTFDFQDYYVIYISPHIEKVCNAEGVLSASPYISEDEATDRVNTLQTILDNIDTTIFVNSIKTREILFVNETLASSLKKTPGEMLGQKCWSVLQENQTGPCSFCPMREMMDDDGNIVAESRDWEFKNTITGKWFLIKDAIIKWIDGSDVHIETTIEITRQKQYAEELEHSASIDMMTGAYNREWGYKMMASQTRSPASDSLPMSLCFVDLDGLKTINDTCGHNVGDEMIISTMNIIRSCVRKSDIICRWGGDEFILLLTSCGKQRAEEIMKEIQSRIDDANQNYNRAYKLSFSYGIVEISDKIPDFSLDLTIIEADKRMYENKVQKLKV